MLIATSHLAVFSLNRQWGEIRMLQAKRIIWGLMPLFILFSVGCTKEIAAHRTVVRRGLVYKIGGNAPFTGIVIGKGREPRHTQAMTFNKSYKNGLLHGESYFYYPNGKIESIVPYSKGKIHGALICYWPNGNPKSRIHFKDGLRGGVSGEMFWDKEGRPI